MTILIIIIAIGVCLGLLLLGGVLFTGAAILAVLLVKFVVIPILLIAGILWAINSLTASDGGSESRLPEPNLTSDPRSDRAALSRLAMLVVGGLSLFLLINRPSKQELRRPAQLDQRYSATSGPEQQGPEQKFRSESMLVRSESAGGATVPSGTTENVDFTSIPTVRKDTAARISRAERKRLEYAQRLQTLYKDEGRILTVSATGAAFDTLELSSLLMRDGSYTLRAARRETVDCPACMHMMRKLGFKTLLLRGSDGEQTYAIVK